MNMQCIHIQTFSPQYFSFQNHSFLFSQPKFKQRKFTFFTVRKPSWLKYSARGFGRSTVRSSVSEGDQQKQVVKRAYPYHEIEPKWQNYWEKNRTFRTPDEIDTSKPKFYVLDMFPYPRSLSPSLQISLHLFVACE